MYEGVLILSPPRSGSSCLTACLSFQGIHLGASPTTVKDAFNAKGYFENQAVLSFNEKVLQSISADIFQTAPLNARQCREATQFAGELAGLMTSQFEARPFLIKDPRIALLQELYRQVLPPVRIISLRRDRQATARSIHHMTHALSRPTVTPEKGERICDLYFQLIDDMAREVHLSVCILRTCWRIPIVCWPACVSSWNCRSRMKGVASPASSLIRHW